MDVFGIDYLDFFLCAIPPQDMFAVFGVFFCCGFIEAPQFALAGFMYSPTLERIKLGGGLHCVNCTSTALSVRDLHTAYRKYDHCEALFIKYQSVNL